MNGKPRERPEKTWARAQIWRGESIDSHPAIMPISKMRKPKIRAIRLSEVTRKQTFYQILSQLPFQQTVANQIFHGSIAFPI